MPETAYLAAETRAPGTVRTNRAVLALLGLLLLLMGVATVLAGRGVFGSARASAPVIDSSVTTFAQSHGWYWPVVGVIALLVALLCLRWLLIQTKSNRLSSMRLEADRVNGHTTLPAAALTAAVSEEIGNYRGVKSATAHLSGSADNPTMTVRIDLDGRVDTVEVHRRVLDQALAHARQALDTESLKARLQFELPRSAARDIR